MARAKKPLPSLEWLEPRVKLSRALSLFSFIALLTLLSGTPPLANTALNPWRASSASFWQW